MSEKVYKNLKQETCDARNIIAFDFVFDNCIINEILLPPTCKRLTAFDSILKKIVLPPAIEAMYCDESGIEELICNQPCTNVKVMRLADNKLTKFNIKINSKPLDIDISNNNISEIKFKIPYHYYFNDEGNPITKREMSEYIDYNV